MGEAFRGLGMCDNRQGAAAGNAVLGGKVLGVASPSAPRRGSPSCPPGAALSRSPDFWQIGLRLTFRPVSERAKPLSDLIIFHFCLIVHILLLAEKEHGSCRGRERRPPLVHSGLLDKLSIFWGLLLNPLYLSEVQSKFPRQWFWHCLGSLQWCLQIQPLCREKEPDQGHLHPPHPPPPLQGVILGSAFHAGFATSVVPMH